MSDQVQEAALRQSFPHYQPLSAGATQMARQLDNALRILRVKEVVERTGLSRSTVYTLMKSDPTFPKKVQLSTRTTGIIEQQLDAWIASRVCK